MLLGNQSGGGHPAPRRALPFHPAQRRAVLGPRPLNPAALLKHFNGRIASPAPPIPSITQPPLHANPAPPPDLEMLRQELLAQAGGGMRQAYPVGVPEGNPDQISHMDQIMNLAGGPAPMPTLQQNLADLRNHLLAASKRSALRRARPVGQRHLRSAYPAG